MQGLISFHPVDVGFFDSIIDPLVAGGKTDPGAYLEQALAHRTASWHARRYVQTLEALLAASEPPPPPEEGTFWQKLRARMERIDYKVDPLCKRVAERVDPELHLRGRPFLIADAAPEAVAEVVDAYRGAPNAAAVESLVRDQLRRIDAGLEEQVRPQADTDPPPDLTYRTELLGELKEIHELARAARRGDGWTGLSGEREPATVLLPTELPWRAVRLHARALPFWMAADVDGLEGICRAAGVPAPDFLIPPWRLLGSACQEFPQLRDALQGELAGERSVGGYVPAEDVPRLMEFLKSRGARIIQAATRAGEGPACARLLKKMRECATYAAGHGLGYVEAAGIRPVEPEAA